MKKRKRRPTIAEETLLMSLACGSTVETAAIKSGRSTRTVYRRLEDPEFRRHLQKYRLEMRKRACGMLAAGTMEAAKTLISLLGSGHSSTARLGSARAVLDLGLKLNQAIELEDRMTKIEERMLGGLD